jgi:hypothetical protein
MIPSDKWKDRANFPYLLEITRSGEALVNWRCHRARRAKRAIARVWSFAQDRRWNLDKRGLWKMLIAVHDACERAVVLPQDVDAGDGISKRTRSYLPDMATALSRTMKLTNDGKSGVVSVRLSLRSEKVPHNTLLLIAGGGGVRICRYSTDGRAMEKWLKAKGIKVLRESLDGIRWGDSEH